MATFIKTIGRCAVNGLSFDLYENDDSSATIRPVKNGHDLPRKQWRKFENVDAATSAVDDAAGEDATGAQRVLNLIRAWL